MKRHVRERFYVGGNKKKILKTDKMLYFIL